MRNAQSTKLTTFSGTSTRRFVRHFLEMVAAMVAGMAILGPTSALIFTQLGWSDLLDYPVQATLVMATNMAIGMSAWMWYRGHTWVSTLEMAAVMYLPFVVLFFPLWVGALSGDTLLVAGHVLMLPAMVVAMLNRRDEYTRNHRRTPKRTGAAGRSDSASERTSSPDTGPGSGQRRPVA